MYRLTPSNAIERLSDGAFIPADPDNRDYAEYLGWLDAGNTPAPVPVVDTRPAVMADFRARREVYLNRLTGIAVRASRAGLNEVAAAADTFAQGLLDLPDHPSVVAAATGPALKAAIMAQYRALAAAAEATPGALNAFAKVAA